MIPKVKRGNAIGFLSILGGRNGEKQTQTYGAITPRTSGDLVKPVAVSHSSRSDDNFVAESRNRKKISMRFFISILQADKSREREREREIKKSSQRLILLVPNQFQ